MPPVTPRFALNLSGHALDRTGIDPRNQEVATVGFTDKMRNKAEEMTGAGESDAGGSFEVASCHTTPPPRACHGPAATA